MAMEMSKDDHRLGRNFYKGLFGDSMLVNIPTAGSC